MNVPSKSPSSTAEKYHFIVPLWGAKYVDMFVNYSLPSQLSPGNLPALPAGMTAYEIYTSADDAKVIWKSDSVKKLRKMVDVSIKTFRDQDVLRDLHTGLHQARYIQNLQKMTWCYQRSLAACRGIDAAFVFMTPDSVWADGAFRFMHECQSAGVRALMALGLITVRPLLQTRLADFAVPNQGVIDISPRRLVSLACDALHPLGISRLVRDGSARWNSAFYWMRHGRGMVARCFYLHPVMVRPRVHLERMPCTVDYRYVQQACPDLGDVRVVTDSDDLFYVDMADLQHVGEALPLEGYSQEGIADWMCEWTDDYHRAYFRQPIVLREDGVGDDDFAEELAESRAFADSLLERYNDHSPINGRTLFPSNLYHEVASVEVPPPPQPPAPAPVQPVPALILSSHPHDHVQSSQRILARARRAAAFTVSLPRRAMRFAYRRLCSRLNARIDRIEQVLNQYRNHVEAVARDLRESRDKQSPPPPPPPASDHLKVHLVRSEYELQRELGLLRADNTDRFQGRHSIDLGKHSDVRALRVVVQERVKAS